MKQYLDLKVDLENPDEARHTIDELVKEYEADKLKWTEEEIAKAKNLAMMIMEQLCLDGYSMIWTVTDGAVGLTIWNDFREPSFGQCYMAEEGLYDIWVEKLVALCIATGREVPKFITDKAGECW